MKKFSEEDVQKLEAIASELPRQFQNMALFFISLIRDSEYRDQIREELDAERAQNTRLRDEISLKQQDWTRQRSNFQREQDRLEKEVTDLRDQLSEEKGKLSSAALLLGGHVPAPYSGKMPPLANPPMPRVRPLEKDMEETLSNLADQHNDRGGYAVQHERRFPPRTRPRTVVRNIETSGIKATLYSDGSIEADFPSPIGLQKFDSMADLEAHVEKLRDLPAGAVPHQPGDMAKRAGLERPESAAPSADPANYYTEPRVPPADEVPVQEPARFRRPFWKRGQ